MQSVIQQIEAKSKKAKVADIRSGDTVKVHQKVKEGGKERIQIFEGLVIKTSRKNSLTSRITVRRIASGIGVEKTYLIHSPTVTKVEIIKRSKVRRNYLSYMRGLRGKGARLTGLDLDLSSVNVAHDEAAEAEEAKIKKEQAESYDPEAAKAEKAAEKAEATAAAAETAKPEAESPKPEAESPKPDTEK